MQRSFRQGLLIALICVLVAGCFVPPHPAFGDGESVPEETARVLLPVHPRRDGTWVVNSPRAGLLGQDRTLALRGTEDSPGRRLTLPAEFALISDRPGTAHSALVRDLNMVLVGGREGHPGPSAIAGVDLQRGRLSWRHELPPGSRVLMGQESFERVLASTCRSGSCRVTAWEVWSGRRLWSRELPGAEQVLDGCHADGFLLSPGDDCGPFVVTRERVGRLDTEQGKPYWIAQVKPPRQGRIDRIMGQDRQVVMATAPAEGSCRATVLASRDPYTEGVDGWQHSFVWHQPQAPLDPHTGCRWDRALPLLFGTTLVLPDVRGTLVATPYHRFGTSQRLAPGEYLYTNGTLPLIIRSASRPDRLLHPRPGERVRPRGLSPAARMVARDFWQDGERLRLFGWKGETLWEGRSTCRAFSPAPPMKSGSSVLYCDGDDLVTVSPAPSD
ncbi:hypothetical protein H9Y04_11990 [Streptomyces sp. TRM66268-LWL]|uniref:Pyrroloquinoline-quinone binding quinoprotein n=1 Tax=Streptomyces polyasparticus TaxID=2767826 RepID=A0ABR7SEI4_9ACTN|nr:hypothetical protein [Streptomyces polyasparticus]MBC9713289.1 hypothetical protein [Streptomyces polyasparticus]